MIQKDAKAYHVLEILSMAGEVGEDMVSLLIPQPDYRKKILQRFFISEHVYFTNCFYNSNQRIEREKRNHYVSDIMEFY